jgi:predicted transcriptional regulator
VAKVNRTVVLEQELAEAVDSVAARSGRAPDQVIEQALRQYLEPSVIDRLWERNRLDEDEAMRIAVEEVRAHRAERRAS